MKKIAAGVSVLALVVVAHLAFAYEDPKGTGAAASSSASVPDPCSSWTKGGGASVGKANPGKMSADPSSSSSASAGDAPAACTASSSSSSSAPGTADRPDQKVKTKSNIKND